jgi:two-component system, OmpR family, phosphate regulon response regulator PhoB
MWNTKGVPQSANPFNLSEFNLPPADGRGVKAISQGREQHRDPSRKQPATSRTRSGFVSGSSQILNISGLFHSRHVAGIIPSMSRQKILVVEDERSLAEVLAYNLSNEGFDVTVASDGQEAVRRAERELPDLVVLDLMLPVIDGLEVCRQLRGNPRTQAIRVLMLTARGEEMDEVVGFSMGADDYVTKPFNLKPLIHRIKALLRRPESGALQADHAAAHGIEIDRLNHRVTVGNDDVQLTLTEFRLLWTLLRQPGRPFTRHELMDFSRGEDANALERTIDVHIRSLRQKLGAKGNLVETVRGVGYRLRPEYGG